MDIGFVSEACKVDLKCQNRRSLTYGLNSSIYSGMPKL